MNDGGKEVTWKQAEDERSTIQLIRCIVRNQGVLDSIRAMDPKKKWWRTAEDARLAKSQMIAAGLAIETGLHEEGRGEGNGWVKFRETLKANSGTQGAIMGWEADRAYLQAKSVSQGQLAGIENKIQKLI